MNPVVLLMCLVAYSLTAPVPESDSDETAAHSHIPLQLMELYRMYDRLQQFDGFYQLGAEAPLNSDEAEEAEEVEEVEGAEGAEGSEPAAEEPTPDPATTDPAAAVSTDTPADPETPLDYLLATNAPNFEVTVANDFDPATITESPFSYIA